MTKLKEPPFKDQPNPNNSFWSQSWFEFLRDIWVNINKMVFVVGATVANHFAMFNASGEIVDSGKVKPSGEVVGTTDTQTLTNKSVPTPTSDLHISNKKYVDDSIVADWEDEIDYWENYVEGYVLAYYDENIKSWTEDYIAAHYHPYFKVGDVVINTDGVNPAVKWGYGTWDCVGTGDWTLT
jgi:hypothetical protein